METNVTNLATVVAENVRVELARRNLGTTDLAKALGISNRVACNRKAGVSEFSISELERLSNWLQVPCEKLFEHESYSPIHHPDFANTHTGEPDKPAPEKTPAQASENKTPTPKQQRHQPTFALAVEDSPFLPLLKDTTQPDYQNLVARAVEVCDSEQGLGVLRGFSGEEVLDHRAACGRCRNLAEAAEHLEAGR